MTDTSAYRGAESLDTRASELNAMEFLVRQVLARAWTTAPVVVRAVTPGTPPTVDVQPLVAQVAGDGRAVPHGTIYGAPVLRLQAGSSAILLDPVPGDIGLALFASHDISAVKAARGAANPGSRRRFDPADAIYLGGILNGAATRFIRMSAAGGLEITDPASVTITAPTTTVRGALVVTQDATIGGKSFAQHHHGGVQTGGGVTGAPV